MVNDTPVSVDVNVGGRPVVARVGWGKFISVYVNMAVMGDDLVGAEMNRIFVRG